ncbi:MAG: ABC transporter ATP-binding protein [Spiroplasma sp.]|nr:ABC transporter ATP-binding protein [Mycoplasmatales bacterium]
MKSNKKALLFISKYIKTYWKSLIIVMVFMLTSTYFQIQAPKLMGESIDQMAKYVISEIGKRATDEMNGKIAQGVPLTKEELQQIEKSDQIPQSIKDFISNSTPEELKLLFEFQEFQKELYMLDSKAIENGNGLTNIQLQHLKESNVNEKAQFYLLSMEPNEHFENYRELSKNKGITQEEIDENYDLFFSAFTKMVLAFIYSTMAMFVYHLLMIAVAGNSTRDMRRGLFGKMQRLSINFYDKATDGDILSKFTNDIDNISNAMNQSFVQIVSQIVLLISIIFVMVREDTSTFVIGNFTITNFLVWIIIAFAIVALLLARIIIKKAHFYVSKQQEKLGVLNGYIDERISGQKVIISYDLEDETIEGFKKYNEDLMNYSINGQIYSGILMPLMNGIGLVNLGVLVFAGAIYVSEGVMTIGLLIAFIRYSQRFFQPLAQIVSQYNMVELATAGANRVRDVMEEPIAIKEIENPIVLNGIHNNVELKNINFGYNPNEQVIKNVSINVEKGKMIALVGPTGSGKTTIMNLLNRFYDVDSGEILFDGMNIKELEISNLRRSVGIVLQDSVLFSGTIFENIAYGVDMASKQVVEKAAKTANIHEYIMELDKGYETHINNNSSIFSTGQKQLIAIARTILTDPDLLILDEATSNVDTVTESNIQAAMENVMKNRTSFVIANRLKTILKADRILVLKDGEVIEEGTHKELLSAKGFYEELYSNQFVSE